MRVYDRCNILTPAERLRYQERLEKSRRGIREDYDRGGSASVALFRQSGMDLSRLQIMQEETRQAQMTKIIG